MRSSSVLAALGCAALVAVRAVPAPAAGKYTLDPSWPMDLAKIGPMNGTSGIDVNPVTGEVYMCQQRGSPRVSVWDGKTGKLLRTWGDEDLDTPHAVRIKMVHGGEPEIWITDMGVGPSPLTGHTIKAFTSTGKLLHTVGQAGVAGTGLKPLQFGNVADLDWTPDQTKMVAVDGDGGPNNRAVELDAKTFEVLASWGGIGGPATQGKFNISHGVAIDKCSRVWVADRANERLQIFDLAGKWLATWTCMAHPPYGVRMFGTAEQAAAGPAAKGRVLVTGGGAPPAWPSGTNALSILEFNMDCASPADLGPCAEVGTIAADHNSTAHFSAIDEATQDIYTCEVSTNKLKKYTYSA